METIQRQTTHWEGFIPREPSTTSYKNTGSLLQPTSSQLPLFQPGQDGLAASRGKLELVGRVESPCLITSSMKVASSLENEHRKCAPPAARGCGPRWGECWIRQKSHRSSCGNRRAIKGLNKSSTSLWLAGKLHTRSGKPERTQGNGKAETEELPELWAPAHRPNNGGWNC